LKKPDISLEIPHEDIKIFSECFSIFKVHVYLRLQVYLFVHCVAQSTDFSGML
jgi:hypothetical protein